MAGTIVIAGGGLAAVRTAEALRDLGHCGRVVVASDEVVLPYDRPPLSKSYLLGRADDDSIRLVAAEKLAEIDVEVRLGAAATGIDREARRVLLADGEGIHYDRLVVATGARATALPMMTGRENALALRSLADARRLRDALEAAPSVAIVGAGFIGLEIAGVARELGCAVVVVEAAPTPLAMLGPELGSAVRRFHERRGVTFRCDALVSAVHGNGRIDELELADGSRVAADVVVVGVGATANAEWLRDSGLELDRGLVCDELGRTSDPRIFGAGDVVVRVVDGVARPTGHWTAAGDQARVVAHVICGREPGKVVEDNYFWSDQSGKRLQFAGTVPADAQVTYVDGDPDEDAFVALCHDGEHVTAVFSLGKAGVFVRRSMPLRRGEKVPAPASA
jgi:3-phenylpropionate/trans-cinnamate dioxygenase ferredoxin reductase subunit